MNVSIFLVLPDKHDWEWHNDNDRMLSVGLNQPDWTRSINKDVSLDTRRDPFFLCISFCFRISIKLVNTRFVMDSLDRPVKGSQGLSHIHMNSAIMA